MLNYQEENRFTIQTEETEEFEGATYQAIVKQDNVYYTEKDNRFFTYAKIPIEALANTNNIDELRTELAKNIVYRIDDDIYERGEYYIDEYGVIWFFKQRKIFCRLVYIKGSFLMAVQMDLAFSEHMMGIDMKVLSYYYFGYGDAYLCQRTTSSERLTPERILNVKGFGRQAYLMVY